MRVKAFTLIEMLVVLALTGILMGIVMGVWFQFDLFGREMRMRQAASREVMLMDHALRTDTRRAREVRTGEEGFVLKGKNDSVAYRTAADRWIREAGLSADTFRVGAIVDCLPGAFRTRIRVTRVTGEPIGVYFVVHRASARASE